MALTGSSRRHSSPEVVDVGFGVVQLGRTRPVRGLGARHVVPPPVARDRVAPPHVSTVAGPLAGRARPGASPAPAAGWMPRANEAAPGYRSGVIELVLDCRDPDSLARFWAAALAYEVVDTSGPYRSLEPIDGDDPGPTLVLQAVTEPKVGEEPAPPRRLRARHRGRGVPPRGPRGPARLSDEVEDEDGERWLVMADPEGNEFCVCEE